jgi:hypothetical protein
MNLGVALLARGDFAEGWDEYEWRWRVPELRSSSSSSSSSASSSRRELGVPAWDGEDPRGRTILLHAEQGFGDAIQFVRYVPIVADRGARVVLECPAELVALFASVRGVERLVVRDAGLPATFDAHLPLMSLGRVMKTDRATIPADVPYLAAPAAQRQEWRERLAHDPPSPSASLLRVGICRAGRVQDAISRARAFRGQLLSALAGISNVAFYELTLPDSARGDDPVPPGVRLIDHTAHLHHFGSAAGLVDALDLVITIDSAMVHLAGSMAKETWLLLPHVADWRWRHVDASGERSLWYPTVRIFRQRTPGDWPELLSRVASELATRAARTRC